jgi:hypothetical protein
MPERARDDCAPASHPGPPTPVHAFALFISGGRLFVAGGSTSEDVTDEVAVLDGLGRSWATSSELSAARSHMAVVIEGERATLIGGLDAHGSPSGAVDHWTGAMWRRLPSLLQARARAGAIELDDGRMLVCGGTGGPGVALDSCELLAPGAAAWVAGPRLRHPHSPSSIVRVSPTRLAVVGGGVEWIDEPLLTVSAPEHADLYPSDSTPPGSVAYASEDVIGVFGCVTDIPTDRYCSSWGLEPRGGRECRPLSVPRPMPAVVPTPPWGFLLVAGGDASVERWSRCDGDTTMILELPSDRWEHGAVLWNGALIVVGGRNAMWPPVPSPPERMIFDTMLVVPERTLDRRLGHRCSERWEVRAR